MSTTNTNLTTGGDSNPDLITGAPGSHPLGTGIGAAAGGAATGAAIGAVAGPVGAAIGVVAGAIAGGLAGKGVAENIDPTVHDAYWRDNHANQPYAAGSSYDDFSGAYRTGYEGAGTHGVERSFDEAENDLKAGYEKTKDAASVGWDKAKHATRAAYEHARDSVNRNV